MQVQTATLFCVRLALVTAFVGCSAEPSEDSARQDAMKQLRRNVGIVHSHMRNFQGKQGFPDSEHRAADGTVTCSWRLTVTACCMDSPNLELSWRTPHNQTFDDKNGRAMYDVTSHTNPSKFTRVFALVGPGTAFSEFVHTNGRDGAEAEPDAILLLDAKNDLIHWMEPGDVELSPLLSGKSDDRGFGNLTPNYSEGFLVAFVDGAVWWLKRDVPHKVLLPFLTVEGARWHDREKELGPYALDKLPPLKPTDGSYLLPPPDEVLEPTPATQ